MLGSARRPGGSAWTPAVGRSWTTPWPRSAPVLASSRPCGRRASSRWSDTSRRSRPASIHGPGTSGRICSPTPSWRRRRGRPTDSGVSARSSSRDPRACGAPTTFPDPPQDRSSVGILVPSPMRGGFHHEEELPVPIAEVEKIWMDGELVDWADAKIHVLSHALHYGSGVFEGIRAYETARGAAVWHLEEHLHRLFRSAKLYHMDLPFSHDELVRATKELIRVNGLTSCYVRPIAFRGYGEMGVNPLNAAVNVSIAVWPWGAYLGEDALEQGVRIKISSWRRNSQNALPASAKPDAQYTN